MATNSPFPPEIPQVGDKVLVTIGEQGDPETEVIEGIVVFRMKCPSVLRNYIVLAGQPEDMAIYHDGERWVYTHLATPSTPATVVVVGKTL